MHIAVCDDNIADRKQTERLLGRQSDRYFKETGERIWIDSFGNVEAFMQNPQMYQGLFVDMHDDECNGFNILKMLLYAGIESPIVMCSSTIDYKALVEKEGITASNIMFLEKPIKVAEITAIVDKIAELAVNGEPSIELRGKDETIYAHGDDIICVKRVRSELEVHLTGNRVACVLDDIVNFYDQCNIFPQICPVNDNGLVNVNHVKKTSFGKVTMDNDMTLPVSFTYRSAISKARQYAKESGNLSS
ncbi:LytR/AlgR family response regulator transcription factor [Butyrivibrio sp. VCB2001]|uniref:LytR/AlgR family response regulator transcription factor n=1 Tax=Butyrivibrio sp. VCB2001 TaxID=1280667 RepID=UPI000410568F|nr:response regulator [Butyrivibrio sp. VCB2001]